MPSSPSQIRLRWIYIAFLLSLLAILAHGLIPHRKLQLVPSADIASLYSDEQSGGNTRAEWVDRDSYHFRCTYIEEAASSKYCGMNIAQGDGLKQGVDFSHFKYIALNLEYTGNAPILRVYFRHYGENYSTRSDSQRTAKYNRSLIPIEHLHDTLTLNIRQFTVADWWIARYGATQELLQPEFTNIINLGIDTPANTPVGVHEFRVVSMEAHGEWISREHWYLFIGCFWFVALLLVSFQKYVTLRRQVSDSAQKLNEAITKARKLEAESAKYRELSQIDQLTQTLNRRGLMQTIDRYDHAKNWFSTAVILLDVDHFKQINDNYGHNSGDKVLAQIGRILRENVRTQDDVGRWGGEEFILICPKTTAAGATAIAEKIRAIIDYKTFSIENDFRVSVSVGISIGHRSEHFEDVYHRADHALYEAKNSGRNCVVVAAEDAALA
ncbi:GGDEF domain-containing protein [Teredinibacter turnerae]|uniref:GGDEF domain-containing protein n=1 Tax=Teredinibacter turnerae TaxID=2426 RepID=UPI000377D29B|nr:GGDEF domain-containing protein [Teredinibacter turnerae]